ncbi:hypothetical protein ElyMa_004434500 [Elysia marginata]|uniref:Uncharacterized protein n=1 Tax=Elysia marginata TaxID=1093978 RepID=A0AAV4HFY5_9GAST|nr:hypothetical protein ElyMa_004434500 [Elysia marginata]
MQKNNNNNCKTFDLRAVYKQLVVQTIRTQEKSRWQVAELSVSLENMWTVPFNQKVLQAVMRTQRIKRWKNGTSDSVNKSQVKKPKDLDSGIDGNKQSHDGSKGFEVSGGFDEDQ